MKSFLLSLFVIAALCHSSDAQSFAPTVTGAAGADAAFSNGSMAWTIGEVMTETYAAGNFFTQGFHQPDTQSVVSVAPISAEVISVYPNPVAESLIIDLSAIPGNYDIELVDMQGSSVVKKSIEAGHIPFQIPMQEYANGIYVLNVFNKKTSTRTSCKINKAE